MMQLGKGAVLVTALALLAAPVSAQAGARKAPARKEVGATAEKGADVAKPKSGEAAGANAEEQIAGDQPAAPAESPLSGPFGRLDTNADGVVTFEEYVAREAERFKRFDKDGDGKIIAEETAPPKMTAEEKAKMDTRRKEREERMEKMRTEREERVKARATEMEGNTPPPAPVVEGGPLSDEVPAEDVPVSPSGMEEAPPPDAVAAPTAPAAPEAPVVQPVEPAPVPAPAPAEPAPKKKKFWPW